MNQNTEIAPTPPRPPMINSDAVYFSIALSQVVLIAYLVIKVRGFLK